MSIKYTENHEWVRSDGDLVVVGITNYAQEQLGEIVYLELPDIDRVVSQGEETAVVESVKAAGDIKAPISGKIVAINVALDVTPETVNQDPIDKGWLYKLEPSNLAELEALMDETSYQQLLDKLT